MPSKGYGQQTTLLHITPHHYRTNAERETIAVDLDKRPNQSLHQALDQASVRCDSSSAVVGHPTVPRNRQQVSASK